MPFKSGARHLFPVLDLIPRLYLNSFKIFLKKIINKNKLKKKKKRGTSL